MTVLVVCGVGIITSLGSHGERRLVYSPPPTMGPCGKFVAGIEITVSLLLLNSTSQIV